MGAWEDQYLWGGGFQSPAVKKPTGTVGRAPTPPRNNVWGWGVPASHPIYNQGYRYNPGPRPGTWNQASAAQAAANLRAAQQRAAEARQRELRAQAERQRNSLINKARAALKKGVDKYQHSTGGRVAKAILKGITLAADLKLRSKGPVGVKAADTLGAPGRTWGEHRDREAARDALPGETEKRARDWEGSEKAWEAEANAIIRRWQTTDEATFSTAERDRLLDDIERRRQENFNAVSGYLKNLEDRSKRPFSGKFGKGVEFFAGKSNAVRKGVWKYTLGEGGKNIPSGATLLDRVSKYFQLKTGTRPGGNMSFSQRLPANEAFNKGTGQGVIRKGPNKWQQTHNTTYGSFKKDVVMDPLSWLGMAGIGRRAGLKATSLFGRAPKQTQTFGQFARKNFQDRIPKGAKRAWNRSWQLDPANNRVDRGIQWLGSQKQTASQKIKDQTGKLFEARNRIGAKMKGFKAGVASRGDKYYADLNDAELKAFQQIQHNLQKGKAKYNPLKDNLVKWVPKSVLKDKRVDNTKLLKFTQKHNERETRRYFREQSAGIKYGAKQGYFALPPRLKKGERQADERLMKFYFQQRRSRRVPGKYFSREDLGKAQAARESAHHFAVGTAGGRRGADLTKAFQALKEPGKHVPRRPAAPPFHHPLQKYKSRGAHLTHKIDKSKAAGDAAFNSGRERLGRALGKPVKAWKASVLALNPNWYKNNAGWNAWVSAQHGSLGEFAKTLARPGRKSKVEGVTGKNIAAIEGKNIKGETGRIWKFGSHVEDSARSALYTTLRKKGYSHDKALKRTNDEFFDYSKKANWERPLNTAYPFWNWDKNIMKYQARMPLRHPLGTQASKQWQEHMVDKPYRDLPDEIEVDQYDEDGNKIKVPVRKDEVLKDKTLLPFYVDHNGKIKRSNPKEYSAWYSSAYLPLLRGESDRTSLNPFLSGLKEFSTGMNDFGQPAYRRDVAANRIPQGQVIAKGWDAYKANYQTKKWIAASGKTKEQQGFDPSKGNYRGELDLRQKFIEQLQSFFGLRTFHSNLPKKEYDSKIKEYMERVYIPAQQKYGKGQFEEKDAFLRGEAKKRGLDLDKDFYEGVFKKNDSAYSRIQKIREARTRQERERVYAEFRKLADGPDYKYKGRDINAFIRAQRERYKDPKFLQMHPDLNLFPNSKRTGYAGGGSGSRQSSTAVSRYGSRRFGRRAKSSVNVGGKWFKSRESANRYYAYRNGSFGSIDNPQTRGQKLAYGYRRLDPDQRKDYFAAQGFTTPNRTRSEWDTLKANKKVRESANLQNAFVKAPDFKVKVGENVRTLTKSYRPPARRGAKLATFKKNKSLTFGGR